MTSDLRGSAPTRTLGERYRVGELIAVGGMGEVWQARDLLLDRAVAIKLLKPEFLSDAGFLERFRAEARHAAGLSHAGIATVYDYGEADGAPYLVMELVRGEPLSALISRSGALPVAQALDIAAQTARALGCAHEAGVVHRDVKPGNILVRPDGVVKVTDFGIARATDAAPITQAGTVVGTANYLSPEQASGLPTGPPSDLYSLGVVTYEMLAGRRPFSVTNPVAVALAHVQDAPDPLPDELPNEVRDVVMRSLAKRPEDRYADAAAFATATEHAAAVAGGLLPAGPLPASTVLVQPGEPPAHDSTQVLPAAAVPPSTAGGRAGSGVSRGRRWLALLAVPLLLVLGISLASALDDPAPRDDERPAVVPSTAPSVTASVTAPATTPPASPTPSPSASPAAPSRPAQVAIPGNLIGRSYDQAAALLRAADLVPARRPVEHALPAGTVVDTAPPAGRRVAPGTVVTLVTSSGPAKVEAPAPEPAPAPPAPAPEAPKDEGGDDEGGDGAGGDGGGGDGDDQPEKKQEGKGNGKGKGGKD